MSTPADTYYDGDYTVAAPTGPLLSWQDPETKGKLYRQKYHQLASEFESLPIGSNGPDGTGSKLVEETQPTDIGSGVVEWERTYATKPPTRIEREPFVHNYQLIAGDELLEVPLYVSSTVTYEYFETADGSGVIAIEAPRYAKVGAGIYTVGGTPAVDGAGVAENSAIRRWRGNFWERATRRVPGITTAAR